MPRLSSLLLALSVALSALLPVQAADDPPLLTYRQMLARPVVTGGVRLAYGPEPQQYGDLWVPDGTGPHPVLVLIHGGCWLSQYDGFSLMGGMAKALRDAGIAVWNIEYRRLGEGGGGYPGTFQDAGAAIDHLRVLALTYPLDLQRVVLSGHSAGGHLALWGASRAALDRASPVRGTDPLRVQGVVSLGGIVDLRDYRATGPDACGGPETIDRLTGAAARTGNVFADTSPGDILARDVAVTLVSGTRDAIVPPRFAQQYAAKAIQAGQADLRELEIDGAGHFELIDATSGAWPVVLADIRDRLRRHKNP